MLTEQPRRYGEWNGNPKGVAEDPTKCREEVYLTHTWIPRQCSRKRGYGPHGWFCKQHAKRKTASF